VTVLTHWVSWPIDLYQAMFKRKQESE